MIKPLAGYVLVEPIEDEKKSAGGLYLPDTAQDKPSKGTVVACGESSYDLDSGMDCPVKENQKVYYKKWINETVSSNGKELLFVKFEDLLGVEDDS